jgi:hypothetical protein
MTQSGHRVRSRDEPLVSGELNAALPLPRCEGMPVHRLPSGARIGQVGLGGDVRAVEFPQSHRAACVLEQQIGVPVRGEVIHRDELPCRAGILQRRLGK